MIECTCSDPQVEFTVAKDLETKVIILEARCENCGRSSTGFGVTVEQALKRATRNWRENCQKIKHIRHRLR